MNLCILHLSLIFLCIHALQLTHYSYYHISILRLLESTNTNEKFQGWGRIVVEGL